MNNTPKVVIIGHVVPTPSSIVPTEMERWAFQYNRVPLEDGSMMDHLAYLKRLRGIPRETDFTVWEMFMSGGLTLKSHLERAGIDVLLVNAIDECNEEREFKRIREFDPAIVCLGTTFLLSPIQLNQVARLLRKHLPDLFIVAGGQHIFTTLLHLKEAQHRSYLKATGLNAFINDVQGEDALIRLIKAFPEHLETVPNLLWRHLGGEIRANERRPENNPLDVPLSLRGIPPGAVIHLRTGRGCNFTCAFCSYPTIGGARELMDIGNVRDSLQAAKDAEVRAVIFSDDTFNVPPDRFAALLDMMIESGLTLPWYSFLRCQFVDARLVDKMRQSGCRGVFLGIESGSDAILANIGKGATVDHYRQGIRWLRDAGIVTVGSFVIGFPGETQATLELTERFIDESGLDYYFMQLFYYLHHTPIHQHAAQYGLKGGGLLWSHATMTWQQALDGMNGIFRRARTIALHQDYNLWEFAYLESKGLSRTEIDAYRTTINAMTVAQMGPPELRHPGAGGPLPASCGSASSGDSRP